MTKFEPKSRGPYLDDLTEKFLRTFVSQGTPTNKQRKIHEMIRACDYNTVSIGESCPSSFSELKPKYEEMYKHFDKLLKSFTIDYAE